MTRLAGALKDPDAARILPRYSEQIVASDPLEIALAQREAQEQKAREDIAKGKTPDADPQDLRGIPVIARGVAGGQNPLHVLISGER